MEWKSRLLSFSLGLGLAAALLPAPALAADHLDGSAAGVKADASTDISDVYSWMSSDGTKMYFIMTLFPDAKQASKFSNAAYYVFHTASRSAFLNMQSTAADIICSFDAAQKISCWVGSGGFVSGDASATAGVSSVDGKVKVFAGLRKDHFFFNLDGFNEVRKNVKARQVTKAITLDAKGCAAKSATNANGLDPTETLALRNQLGRAAGGGAGSAQDFFKDFNTLAIVMEVDKTLVTTGGPIVSVWAGTHKKQ